MKGWWWWELWVQCEKNVLDTCIILWCAGKNDLVICYAQLRNFYAKVGERCMDVCEEWICGMMNVWVNVRMLFV